MMPVGMVVPTLGSRPHMLAECLRSLADQSGVQLDAVLVTTEQSVDRLTQQCQPWPVIAQRGTGIAAAVTTGWQYLGDRVEAVAWLGDDDRLRPGALLAAATALDGHPEAVMVYGRTRYMATDGSAGSELRPGLMGPCMLRMGHNLMLQPGCLYRRTAVEAIGGLDHTVRLAFDVDLHRRLLKHGRAHYVPMVLGEVRPHADSLTVRHRGESTEEADMVLIRQMPAWARRTRPVWFPASCLLMRMTAKLGSR